MAQANLNNDELKAKYLEQKKQEFEQNCYERNVPDACFSLGEWYQLFGGDVAKASEIYKAACTGGHANSCFNQGMVELKTPGRVHANEQGARQFFKSACDLGHYQGCTSYAALCMAGVGGPKACEEAMGILNRMCNDQADARACLRVGAEYLKPDGCVPRDTGRAHAILTRACNDLGHPNACQILAVMYAKGDGVGVNVKLSDEYKRKTKELYKSTGEDMGRMRVQPGGEGA
jgi:TPR repeat protein